MLHAARLVEPDHLCGLCRGEGQCKALDRALKAAEISGREADPRFTALAATEDTQGLVAQDARNSEG